MKVDIAKAPWLPGTPWWPRPQPRQVCTGTGEAEDLLVVKLDITDRTEAEAAVGATVGRFSRTDVLVNKAGHFIAGFFEEIDPEQFRAQTETTLFGPMNITRAVLPVMRAQPLRAHRAGVLHRLRRVPVRPRGLDGVAGP